MAVWFSKKNWLNLKAPPNILKLDEDTIDYYHSFFETNKDYWTQEAVQLELQGKTRFNIFAFLLSLGWFLYRKMYRESLIIAGAIVLLSILQQWIYGLNVMSDDAFILFNLFSTLIISGVLGFLANRLYIQHCDQKIAEILERNPDESRRQTEIEARGGTNMFLAIGVTLGILLLDYLG